MGDLGLVLALVAVGYIVGVWTGAVVFRQRQLAYEEAVPAEIASPARFEAFARRGPPEPVRSSSEDELRLSAAFEAARLEIELARVGELRLESRI
jgi:hypothetical protein